MFNGIDGMLNLCGSLLDFGKYFVIDRTEDIGTSLKKYFKDIKDACLIIHEHSFLHKDNFQEKDFIILNLSKGYIVDIEVKASYKKFDYAEKQVK